MSATAAAFEEYDFWQLCAHRAEKSGRQSDAEHYRRMAQDAIAQLRREERTK